MMKEPVSIPDVVHVEILRGKDAREGAPPDFLVEVPHGADAQIHYDTHRAQLTGQLPDDLDVFFHMNTDVGAWPYGRATAQKLVEISPSRTALLVRALIPRTFIDCNRPADHQGGRLDEGQLTAGIPAYVKNADDKEHLRTMHRAYVDVAAAAYNAVCARGGLALSPHTYGPRTLGIQTVDDTIVDQIRWAAAPERVDTWSERADIDLLTRDADGTLFAPEGLEEELLQAFTRAGYNTKANDTYNLHAATLGYTWSLAHPGQVLCLEVRRDLLVKHWSWTEETHADDAKCARVADVLAPALATRLDHILA
jgi:N-formylglutamate amidohydrolase